MTAILGTCRIHSSRSWSNVGLYLVVNDSFFAISSLTPKMMSVGNMICTFRTLYAYAKGQVESAGVSH